MAPHDVRSSRGLLLRSLKLVPGGLGAGAHGGHADIQQIRLARGEVDAVLPRLPMRQWVLTVPYRFRYQIAWDHGLSRAVLEVSWLVRPKGPDSRQPATSGESDIA